MSKADYLSFFSIALKYKLLWVFLIFIYLCVFTPQNIPLEAIPDVKNCSLF